MRKAVLYMTDSVNAIEAVSDSQRAGHTKSHRLPGQMSLGHTVIVSRSHVPPYAIGGETRFDRKTSRTFLVTTVIVV